MINFLCGVVSGVFTGFGLGGGIFLIMLLGWVSSFSQLEIQSINLIYYIPTAMFSVWVYSKNKNVDFKVGMNFIIIGSVAAIVGAKIANSMDVLVLRKLFALYLIGIGVYFLLSVKKSKAVAKNGC